MAQKRVTVRLHTTWSRPQGGAGRHIPGANYEQTVTALENIGFRRTAETTDTSLTLGEDFDQRYHLPDADFVRATRALRGAGFVIAG